MKTIIFLVALFIGVQLSYTANAQDDAKTKTTKKASKKTTASTANNTSGNVYYCDSKGAKAYHSKKDCAMMKKCKGTAQECSKADAEAKGLTACKSCNKSAKSDK